MGAFLNSWDTAGDVNSPPPTDAIPQALIFPGSLRKKPKAT
jgi:hypothetical protein